MKFLDLFAGIGGFRLGMESAGHECIGFCEIDKFARASYKAIHDTEGEISDWLELNNVNIFAEAWVNGYKVEKEKRYLVKIKGICGNHETLNREKHSNKWLFSDREENSLYNTKFTRKELEDAGFGEVFNSPLFEVEEV